MRRWIRPALSLAGLVVVAYLLYQVGPAAVWTSVRALRWWLLLVICFPFSLSAALDTLAWRVLFRDAHPPFGVLLRARLAGEAVNLATPTASVGGEPLKAYLIRPWARLTEGLATVVVDKTTVVAGQWLYLAAGLAAALAMLPLRSPLVLGGGALLLIEALAVGGFILVQIRGVFGGGGRILGRIGLGPREQYLEALGELDRALADLYRERRGRLLGAVLLHCLAWAGGGLEIYLVLTLAGIPVPLGTALVIESLGAGVKFASFMIPASLGALEGGYVAICAAFGLGGAAGFTYVVVRRLREIAWAALGFVAAPGPRPGLHTPEPGAS